MVVVRRQGTLLAPALMIANLAATARARTGLALAGALSLTSLNLFAPTTTTSITTCLTTSLLLQRLKHTMQTSSSSYAEA